MSVTILSNSGVDDRYLALLMPRSLVRFQSLPSGSVAQLVEQEISIIDCSLCFCLDVAIG